MRKISVHKLLILLSALICSFAGIIFLHGLYITYVLLLPATDKNSMFNEARNTLAVPKTTSIIFYLSFTDYFASALILILTHLRPYENGMLVKLVLVCTL